MTCPRVKTVGSCGETKASMGNLPGHRRGLTAQEPGFPLQQPVALAFDVEHRGMIEPPIKDRGGQTEPLKTFP